MKTVIILSGLMVAVFAISVKAVEVPPPYAGQDQREIKALSADEVMSLETGKGMGLAKAAELNGYPGPAHVLQLAQRLNLTPEQQERTQALFQTMELKAIPLGKALIAAERNLDELFASGGPTPALVSSQLVEIGRLQASVRGAHLEVHLIQADILTKEQKAQYAALRGYGSLAKTEAAKSRAHKH